MEVLDHGKVELIDFMGGDARVCQAARVSLGNFFKGSDPEKDRKLLNYLMKHRHGTPFEHSVFTFYVKAPIFVERQWVRHRIGSFNQISFRYAEPTMDYYVPREARVADDRNRQSSKLIKDAFPNKAFSPTEGMGLLDGVMETIIVRNSEAAKEDYVSLLGHGIAKELARIVLPVNFYTEFVWTVNARSLMNFTSLRSGQDAQLEIREYSNVIFQVYFSEKMPKTAETFAANGYVAP